MIRFCFVVLGSLAGTAAIPAAAEPVASEPARKVTTVRADSSSGRLIRTVAVSPKVIQPVVVKSTSKEDPADNPELSARLAPDASINDIVEATAKKHQVDPLLVHSVIQVESGYNKYAVSHAGAQGLMQLIPSTARRFGVKNVFDPRENIEAGVKYLKQLQTMFRDDRLALAAYNAGENAVTRYGTIPPYSETQNYVYQVGRHLGAARRATTAQLPKPAEAKPKKIEQFVDANGTLHLQMQQ